MFSRWSGKFKLLIEREEQYNSEKSIQHHLNKNDKEDHKGGSDFIKGIMYGALDGIVTSFAFVLSNFGYKMTWSMILGLGFLKLIGDALSMGLGDYLSTKSELEYSLQEQKREKWECQNFFDGEKQEMVDIYKRRGMSEDEAVELVGLFSKNVDNFVDMMMYEELGLLPPNTKKSSCKPAMATFASFILFGSIPLIPLVISAIIGNDEISVRNICSISCCVITILSMFVLGAARSYYSTTYWYVTGLEMVLIGMIAASSSYGISYLGDYFVDSSKTLGG